MLEFSQLNLDLGKALLRLDAAGGAPEFIEQFSIVNLHSLHQYRTVRGSDIAASKPVNLSNQTHTDKPFRGATYIEAVPSYSVQVLMWFDSKQKHRGGVSLIHI